MNQNYRRNKARVIAVARADESQSRKVRTVYLTLVAVCAIAALLSLPSLWV